MNDAPNDPDVNQMMAVFDKLSRQADTAKDEMAMAVNSFAGRAQDVIADKRAEIAQLRAQLAERDATIAEIIGDDNLENQYLFQIAELRGRVAKHKATIAERDATIAELRAQVATLTERLDRCTCTDDYGDVKE